MTKPAEISVEDKEIVFYCKDCEDIVETNRLGKKYVYKCKKCGTKNVAFGTKKSIYSFFRLDEKKKKKEKDEKKTGEPNNPEKKEEQKKDEKKS